MPSRATATRGAVLAAALVAGAGVGVLGSFLHPLRLGAFPVGLLAALGLSAVVFAGAGLAEGHRSGPAAAAAGWMAPVLVLSSRRPEGDLIVASTSVGYAWLLIGMALAGAAIALPWEIWTAPARG